MAQYIGARYTPRFLGTYDPTQNYENLDVVDNGSGTSYIAKIPVPAGTPLTDITYWALYGSANGAIINLQNQIGDLSNINPPLSNTDLVSAINDLNNINLIYPESFGAVGDGVTDDTQAIQDCINEVSNAFIILKGSYLITSKITLKSNLTMIGCGGSFIENITTLSPYEGVFEVSNAKNITLKNIIFKGPNDTGSTQYTTYAGDALIDIKGSENIVIDGCISLGCDHGYAFLTQNCNHVYIRNNHVQYYLYCAIAGMDTTNNLYVENNVVLYSRYCPGVDSNHYGIVLSGYSTTTYTAGHNLHASNNYIEDDIAHLWEGIDSHGGENIYIENNTIKGLPIGIAAIAKLTGTPTFTCSNLHINNNTIISPAGSSPYTAGNVGISFGGYNVEITGNIIDYAGRYVGLSPSTPGYGSIIGGEQISYVTIANNTILHGGGVGIGFLTNHGYDVKVNGNYIRVTHQVAGKSYAFYFYDGTMDGFFISDNDIIMVPYIHFSSGTNTSIKLNNSYAVLPQASYMDNYQNILLDYIDTANIGNITAGYVGHMIKASDPSAAGPKFWTCTGTTPLVYTPTV